MTTAGVFKGLGMAAALLLAAQGAQAEEACLDHFTAEGNVITGKTYKTWATVPSVRLRDAYARAYAFTIENGFTVTNGDKDMGVISAVQSVSYGKGKTVPLNIVLRDEQDGVKVAISYATSGGLVSPEAAIKKHFCLTVAAVASGAGAKAGADDAAPAAPKAAAAAGTMKAMRGYASATPEQEAAIGRLLPKNVPSDKIRAMVAEAEPTIKEFVERLSCLTEPSGASALNAYAAPGVDLGNAYVGLRPMRSTPYHNKAACLTVTRVHGWSAPALNALRFEVVYSAEDSGETAKTKHELVKQPDGSWLVTSNYF